MNITPPSKFNGGLHIPYQINIFNIHDTIEALTCKQINDGLVVQIGSKSEEAYIYKLIIDNIEFAVKIPKPYYHKTDEYAIHKYLSDKYPEYFINIYGIKKCPIFLDEKDYVTDIMFMELALGDLKQIINDGVNERLLLSYINDIFDSIAIMAREGIYHNDLHIGNVFINKQSYAVIGDFGKSLLSKYISSSIEDLKKFLRSLRNYLVENSPNLSSLINLINSFLNPSSSLINISRYYQDSGEYWSSEKAYEVIVDLKKDWMRMLPY